MAELLLHSLYVDMGTGTAADFDYSAAPGSVGKLGSHKLQYNKMATAPEMRKDRIFKTCHNPHRRVQVNRILFSLNLK